MKKGREAAGLISKDFKAPIKLEFEKIYCPYLLMAKKRYVGVYYSSSHLKHDKIDKKGFESVRRDNCYLIREMLENILDLLLCKNDTDGIAVYVKKIIGNLVQNKIDISKLVITKAISKNT
jgi:DNA polymerase delta subunit 1